jgi:hypothetical protein
LTGCDWPTAAGGCLPGRERAPSTLGVNQDYWIEFAAIMPSSGYRLTDRILSRSGQLGPYTGIAAFRIGLADSVKILNGIRVIRFTAHDDSCGAALELDTVFGVIPFLEHFHIVSGQILSVRAYYDPRPVLDGMKQKP